jgi:RNA polymerase sigma-70 factor (ECF subfamily)
LQKSTSLCKINFRKNSKKFAKKAKFREQNARFAHLIMWRKSAGSRKDEDLAQKQDSLVERLKAGDHCAAEEFVDEYYQRIYSFMRRLGHSRQASEDLAQESFFQAWHHIGRLKDEQLLSSWLYRIALNASRHYWRRHHSRIKLELPGMVQAENTEKDKLEEYEQLCILRNAVGQLPTKLREVIVLHYMQELTIAQAAKAANISVGTFKSRLNRALKTLRKQLPSLDGESQ